MSRVKSHILFYTTFFFLLACLFFQAQPARAIISCSSPKIVQEDAKRRGWTFIETLSYFPKPPPSRKYQMGYFTPQYEKVDLYSKNTRRVNVWFIRSSDVDYDRSCYYGETENLNVRSNT